jgi:hypothetical protein
VDETPANVVEELLRDATDAQRAKGLIPRVTDSKAYLQGVVETMEKRDEDQRLRIKPKPMPQVQTKERSSADMESEYEKRLRRAGQSPLPGSWSVTREPVRPATKQDQKLKETQKQALLRRRFRERLSLLRSKPDWAEKLKRINPLAVQGQLGPEKQKHAHHLVMEVIRASDVTFGSWMKAPPKKLIFT